MVNGIIIYISYFYCSYEHDDETNNFFLQISNELAVPRSWFGLSAEHNWIYIFGGETTNDKIFDDAQKMNLLNGEIVKLKPMLTEMGSVYSTAK